MRNFLQIAQGVNILPLMLSLQRQPELWGQKAMRKELENGAHSAMDDIWLRYNKTQDSLAEMSKEHDSSWYPAFYNLPESRSIIFNLMAAVEGERLGGVLITRIPPGGKIQPHKDDGWHVRYYDKFYVSIKNNPGSRFFCEDEVICPKSGDVYWFDNTREHWVENHGDDDRITMIVCIRSHKYGDRHVD
jgi:hypothetical protein